MEYILKEELDLIPLIEKRNDYYYILSNYSRECRDYYENNIEYVDFKLDKIETKYIYYFFEIFQNLKDSYFRLFTTNHLSTHVNHYIIMK